MALAIPPLGGLIFGLRVIHPDGLSGRLQAGPRLEAAKPLVMHYNQLLGVEAPDELSGHGGAQELLVGPPGHGDPGLSP